MRNYQSNFLISGCRVHRGLMGEHALLEFDLNFGDVLLHIKMVVEELTARGGGGSTSL